MTSSGADTLFIDHAIVCTGGATGRVLNDHGVFIENGLIAALTGDHQPPKPAAKTIDANGKVLLPGFINAHTHAYSAFARGMPGIRPASTFIDQLKNLWWRLDSALTIEDCYFSAMLLCLESIRHGTTSFIDHHASPRAVAGSLTAIDRAVRETGMRACLCYEISDRDGAGVCAEGIEENRSYLRRCATTGDRHLTALIGLHASFTLNDNTLDAVAELGRAAGAGFHIHLGESAADQEITLKQSGVSVTERLHRHGILGERTIAAHCVHVGEKEINLLVATGTMAVHNPQSNLNNAVGIADIPALLQAGVLVGLGTDAMTTNMLEEARAGIWAQHLRAHNPSIGFTEIARALLENNPRIAQRIFGQKVGVIAVGSAADLILADYRPPTPLTDDNYIGHLIFGLSQAATDTTIVGGNIVMEGRRLVIDIDEERIYARSRELALSLWKRLSLSSQ
jgi:putative selenium metabolism protein SsnA